MVSATQLLASLAFLGVLARSDGLHRRAIELTASKDGVNAAGYYYSLYNDNHAGADYTEYPGNGRFQLKWNVDREYLGGKGYRGGSTRKLTWDGNFKAEGDYTLAAYGCTTDPVTEWYIVEQYGTGTPGNGHILGQVNVDGGVYDVHMLLHRNVPGMYGVTNFNQLWSVRRNHHTAGSVNVTAYFKHWKELGLQPGNPVFQMMTARGVHEHWKSRFPATLRAAHESERSL
ncbi:putative endo-1 [Aspergillus bombycis]|uniref:Endo-1,4-beta-xylanase n=1 Tax=Aspergillus bombycis TaxID=109264 RepID=A0A1F8AFR8_9EURO|nr:putative endo-1 [Aspergillus bombycis]OGM50590.1 putative endo-1 [Aspergillus bombycis]